MARNPSGLPFDERIPWNKPADSRGPDELRESDSCRECPWEPCLTPEVIREFGFSRDDAQALETVAEALFRSELSDDAAVAAFDRVFGWAAAQDFGNVDVTDGTMALIRARRAS
jgi:hypothetical protein